ncbi:MAG: tectonin domain-containing protein [Candidatus Competibacteraceae bacterium]|nr:tectonin domain-containing protein [Candidatus Competibacteraceae bacterium]
MQHRTQSPDLVSTGHRRLQRDGKADLAGVNCAGAIYHATDRATFTVSGTLVQLVVLGDFNGDGRADLAGLNSAGAIYYTTNRSTWTRSRHPTRRPAGDFDGDGGRSGRGRRRAGTSTTPPTGAPGPASPALWFAGGDFNGDGKADLAGVNGAGHIYTTTDRSTWTRTRHFGPVRVAGDFAHHGKAHLALGQEQVGAIWYTTNRSTWTHIPGTLVQLVAGDFDGDGKADLAGVNSAGAIYYTTNRSTWTPIPGVLTRLAGDAD